VWAHKAGQPPSTLRTQGTPADPMYGSPLNGRPQDFLHPPLLCPPQDAHPPGTLTAPFFPQLCSPGAVLWSQQRCAGGCLELLRERGSQMRHKAHQELHQRAFRSLHDHTSQWHSRAEWHRAPSPGAEPSRCMVPRPGHGTWPCSCAHSPGWGKRASGSDPRGVPWAWAWLRLRLPGLRAAAGPAAPAAAGVLQHRVQQQQQLQAHGGAAALPRSGSCTTEKAPTQGLSIDCVSGGPARAAR